MLLFKKSTKIVNDQRCNLADFQHRLLRFEKLEMSKKLAFEGIEPICKVPKNIDCNMNNCFANHENKSREGLKASANELIRSVSIGNLEIAKRADARATVLVFGGVSLSGAAAFLGFYFGQAALASPVIGEAGFFTAIALGYFPAYILRQRPAVQIQGSQTSSKR